MQKWAETKNSEGPVPLSSLISTRISDYIERTFWVAFVLISVATTAAHWNRRHRRVISDFVSLGVRDNLETVHSGSTWLCRLRIGLRDFSLGIGRSSTKDFLRKLLCECGYTSRKKKLCNNWFVCSKDSALYLILLKATASALASKPTFLKIPGSNAVKFLSSFGLLRECSIAVGMKGSQYGTCEVVSMLWKEGKVLLL